MANHRDHPPGQRKAFTTLLALSIGFAVSIVLPNLRGEPPTGSRQNEELKDSKVQIRFPKNASSRIIDGKLNADVERASSGKTTNSLVSSVPVSQANSEEKNQKIAVDWKDPLFVFFVTGNQTGYIEPCGCTGLENQKGGLSRRDTFLTSVRQRGWNVIPIDGGGQVFQEHELRRRGRQADIKFKWTAEAFNLLDYQAATFGEDDLMLTVDSLMHPMIDKPGLFVSANVSILPEYDVKYKTLTVKNKKIGITAVLGDDNAKKVENEDTTISKAIPALKEVSEKLRAEKCDFTVLISHASLEETREIAKAVPSFSLVITSGGYGEPTFQPEQIAGTSSLMVQAGTKGMYTGLFGVFDNPKQPFQYQRVALSSQFEDSPRVTELFGKYQDELKAVTIEGLGKRPMTHPTTREFVGSEKCGECHTIAFEIWKDTPHAHATDTIIQPPERPMARHFDPECLSCHVTGWNAQSFVPYRTGYESLERTPHMVANGCENCHGPGSKHVAAELGDVPAEAGLLEKLRNEMKLPLARANDKCAECHDLDNSPDFHRPNAFEEFWEKVKHYGKD
ncbi:MAG TPA: multiheme c-type cytochrome [Pirellula sp.]|nr:multiheme c-type cytochrome [Pirellula sp.]